METTIMGSIGFRHLGFSVGRYPQEYPPTPIDKELNLSYYVG